jgi:DGQHR domain-containing protein
MDYLVPYGRVCLVGEITGRSDPDELRRKYRAFCKHYTLLARIPRTSEFWGALGVAPEALRQFVDVDELTGFFITTALESFDTKLDPVPGVAVFYRRDWELLKAYRETIGSYAKPHFLSRLGVSPPTPPESITISREHHGLIRSSNRRVASGDVGAADVYTFEVSPYQILGVAQVFRRDSLPDLSPNAGRDYQRPLLSKKLAVIRGMLERTDDFMFPNSILVVLSADCTYSATRGGTLMIPKRYGTIEVIDGQHRLFSYASPEVAARCGDHARLMVTAIRFRDQSQTNSRRYNAKTFVEINTTQTRVPISHVHAIAYSVIGDTGPRSLGAAVLLSLNEREGAVRGLFETSQTGRGVIKTTTVLTVVHPLTNLEVLHVLGQRSSAKARLRRQGYEALLAMSDLPGLSAEQLVHLTVAGLERYLGLVRRTFRYDWPKRGVQNPSSLAFAKMFAAFIRLLRVFITEGLNWQGVEEQLLAVRANLLQLREMSGYRAVLLDPGDPKIPGSGPSITQNFRFLDANRREPTPVQTVVARRRRRRIGS